MPPLPHSLCLRSFSSLHLSSSSFLLFFQQMFLATRLDFYMRFKWDDAFKELSRQNSKWQAFNDDVDAENDNGKESEIICRLECLTLCFVTTHFQVTSIRLWRFVVGIVFFTSTFLFLVWSLGYSNVLINICWQNDKNPKEWHTTILNSILFPLYHAVSLKFSLF